MDSFRVVVVDGTAECWSVKMFVGCCVIDVGVKIHCIATEPEITDIIVDLMGTEITVKSNNCWDLGLFRQSNGLLNWETERFLATKLEGYVIEMFAGDIMHAIIQNIEKHLSVDVQTIFTSRLSRDEIRELAWHYPREYLALRSFVEIIGEAVYNPGYKYCQKSLIEFAANEGLCC